MRVMRASPAEVTGPPASAPARMVRNLTQRAGRPWRPTRVCTKKAGPGEDGLMTRVIRALVEVVAELTGFQGRIVWDTSKPNGQPRRCLDVSRAERAFGFRARTTFDLPRGARADGGVGRGHARAGPGRSSGRGDLMPRLLVSNRSCCADPGGKAMLVGDCTSWRAVTGGGGS